MNSPKRSVTILAVVTLLGLIPVAARRITAARPTDGARPIAEDNGPSGGSVIYFPGEKVKAAFAKGETLVSGDEPGRNYSVFAMRRDRPGEAETHALDTDIFYVVEGSATFVTGGAAIDSKTTAPNEMRGASITGGETRHLSQGDVLIIPKGVPHWFKAVESPFLYYVVKVR